MFKNNRVTNIIKVLFVLFFLIGLIAKYLIDNEMLSDISFYAISLFFVYFLLVSEKDGEKK